MRTRTQKRAGRKRGEVDREPSGRPQRPPQRRNRVKKTVTEARERVYGVPKNFSDNPQSGYALGILYYKYEIDRRQHDAGLMIAELIHDFFRIVLNKRPPIAQAMDMARVSGRSTRSDEPHPSHDEVKARYAKMQFAVLDVDFPGKPVSHMISRLCMADDRESMVTNDMLDKLRIGLNRVHREFEADIGFRFAGQKLIRGPVVENHAEVV